MSLICNECAEVLAPTKEIPGRHGVLIHPVVLSLLYMPDRTEDGKIQYKAGYMRSETNISVCLSCVKKIAPRDKMHNVYEALGAETNYRRGEGDLDARTQWFSRFDRASQQISRSRCFFSGEVVEGPHFEANIIDPVRSKTNDFSGTYSITRGIEEGMTRFKISFRGLEEKFPKTFKEISYNLCGKNNPDNQPGMEIHISSDFAAALKRETGIGIEGHIEKILKDGQNIKIIYETKNNPK